jgi:exodeoxyribonuclease-3
MKAKMKVITINVCGIRASEKKGLFEWLRKVKADFICMQETRALEEQISEENFLIKGYSRYLNVAEKKGYSGVAIYTKHKPLKIQTSFSKSVFESEGRFILADYKDYSIASVYFPSGSSGEIRQNLKYEFMSHFEKFVKNQIKKKKRLIICGDYNIAHTKDDIKNWKSNQNNSGFLPEEREWMTRLINKIGLKDAFRIKCKKTDVYTWWSNRGNAYNNNVGWRIDYQMITDNFSDKVKSVSVYKDNKFSDHAPLIINYDI